LRILGRVHLEADRIDTDLPHEQLRWEDVVLLVRIGPCRVATYDAMSAELSVRGAVSGLGLEDVLCGQTMRIRRLFAR
jgi:hypothetical protein